MKNKVLVLVEKLLIYSFIGVLVQAWSFQDVMADPSNTQDFKSVKEVYVDVNFSNTPLKQVFSILENKTGFSFGYDEKHIDKNITIDLQTKNKSLEFVLIEISKVASLRFRQVNNDIDVQVERRKRDIEYEVEIIQAKNIRGKVVSEEDGQGLPGVNVIEKGTTNGTVTDIEGNYTLNVDENSTIVFSMVGFMTQEIEVAGRSVIDVTMTSDVKELEELVIVGYGEQKKKSVVGSVVQAKGEELMQSGGVSTVGQALTGRLPGVISVASTGRPGAEEPDIFIRGRSSWNGDGQPLILVDGIERPMNNLDMNEIEDISVLKDASATAVFGVKGANGVILITTKRGKAGKPQLSITANSTLKTPSRLPA